MRKSLCLILVVAMFLGACASAMVTPQTTIQKIAYAKATLTGLNNSAASLLRTGNLSLEDAQAYEREAMNARIFLDYAEIALKTGDEATAMENWQKLNMVLIKLNQYLLERSKK